MEVKEKRKKLVEKGDHLTAESFMAWGRAPIQHGIGKRKHNKEDKGDVTMPSSWLHTKTVFFDARCTNSTCPKILQEVL